MKCVFSKIFIYFTSILFLFFASCSSENYDELQAELDENITKWDNRNITKYTYNYSLACGECTQLDTETLHVYVENNIILSVSYVYINSIIDPEEYSNYYTISDFFDKIQNAIDKKYYSIEVTYDTTYGYPIYISIDEHYNVADDEYGYHLSALEIL